MNKTEFEEKHKALIEAGKFCEAHLLSEQYNFGIERGEEVWAFASSSDGCWDNLNASR